MSGPILLILRIALLLALYAFLAWALVTLWRDIKRQDEILAHQQAPPITLLPIADGGLDSLHFRGPMISIGRDPFCDLALEDKTVSATHARLSYHHGHWWVEDLNSRNGTFLNDEPVAEQFVLTSGDEIRCGQVSFKIDINQHKE